LFWARARLCWLGSHRVPGSNLWQCGLVLDIRSRHWFGLCFGSRFWPSFRTWVGPCFGFWSCFWCRCGINDRFGLGLGLGFRFRFWLWFRCGINDRFGLGLGLGLGLWFWFWFWFRLWFFTDDGSRVNAQ
jgi:hypothetical protein